MENHDVRRAVVSLCALVMLSCSESSDRTVAESNSQKAAAKVQALDPTGVKTLSHPLIKCRAARA
jgi:hypothetical protein